MYLSIDRYSFFYFYPFCTIRARRFHKYCTNAKRIVHHSEPVQHLFARILLASFLGDFAKILGNPQKISSVFHFISQKI